MMEVLRYSLAGVYSVLSWLSHSILVLPELRWSRLLFCQWVFVGVCSCSVEATALTRSHFSLFDMTSSELSIWDLK
jgi:hypothetical protein